MDIAALNRILSGLPSHIEKEISNVVRQILTAAEPYRWEGGKFSFEENPDLDKEINSLLLQLSDEIQEHFISVAIENIEEDSDTLILWAAQRANIVENTDKYVSRLKYILGGWIAIEFFQQRTMPEMQIMIMEYMENPFISPAWQQAEKDSDEFFLPIIRNHDYGWGKGSPISPAKGIRYVFDVFFRAMWQKLQLATIKAAGYSYYKVVRTTGYPCDKCDAACIPIYPIEKDDVLPIHPLCRCRPIPYSFQEDEIDE